MSESQHKPSNPPAFARPYSLDTYGDFPREVSAQAGMTLRDYFAAAAMQAIYAGPGAVQVAERDTRYDETNWSEVVASNAYEIADAMLAAREATR